MQKTANNPLHRYLFILPLCITLLIAQISGLHIHHQHDDHSAATLTQVTALHAASSLHDIDISSHHHAHGQHHDHHSAAIDISQDYLLKKAGPLSYLALIVFFAALLLYLPRLRCLCTRNHYRSSLDTDSYYLLRPPLRAPPLK